jgi:hypothetical protein
MLLLRLDSLSPCPHLALTPNKGFVQLQCVQTCKHIAPLCNKEISCDCVPQTNEPPPSIIQEDFRYVRRVELLFSYAYNRRYLAPIVPTCTISARFQLSATAFSKLAS